MDWFLIVGSAISVVLILINHWMISNGNLQKAYPIIVVIATMNIITDIYLALTHLEQLGMLLYMISNTWAIFMAMRGMRRLKKEQKEDKRP